MKKPLSKWWSKIRKSAYGHINKAEQERAYIRYHWKWVSYEIPSEWRYVDLGTNVPLEYQYPQFKMPGVSGYLIRHFDGYYSFDFGTNVGSMQVAIYIADVPSALSVLSTQGIENALSSMYKKSIKGFQTLEMDDKFVMLDSGAYAHYSSMTWLPRIIRGVNDYDNYICCLAKYAIVKADAYIVFVISHKSTDEYDEYLRTEFEDIINSLEFK